MSPGEPLSLSPLEDLDRLAGADLDDRLLPARPAAARHPAALRLRAHLDHVHTLDVDVEQLLDRLPDLRLVGVLMDAERVLAARLDLLVALLGHHGCQQDFVGMETHDALPWSSSSALWLTSTDLAQTSAETSISAGVVTTTPSRLRNDFTIASWPSCATTTSGRSFPHASTSAAALLVAGAWNESSARTPSVPSSACVERTARNAARSSLRFTLQAKLVSGANAAPPPVQCGARVVPARARPVPFWRHGFERPPATSERF